MLINNWLYISIIMYYSIISYSVHILILSIICKFSSTVFTCICTIWPNRDLWKSWWHLSVLFRAYHMVVHQRWSTDWFAGSVSQIHQNSVLVNFTKTHNRVQQVGSSCTQWRTRLTPPEIISAIDASVDSILGTQKDNRHRASVMAAWLFLGF